MSAEITEFAVFTLDEVRGLVDKANRVHAQNTLEKLFYYKGTMIPTKGYFALDDFLRTKLPESKKDLPILIYAYR